jgi:6-phosphogluconolactonase
MDLHPNIEVYQCAAELEQNAAEKIVLMIDKAIGERGVCSIALSGGETPRPVYHILGSSLIKERIDWSRVHLFFTDERVVPPTDPQSNFGMINREFISHINISYRNIHRIAGEEKAELAAADYERELREYFSNQIIRFDVVLLGLGEDGHTASIFPGTKVVNEEKAFVAAVYIPHLSLWRVTLTYRSINNAREILFLVSGKKKGFIVRHILKTSAMREEYPATLVQPVDGNILWMLDKDAAEEYRKL